MIGNNSSINSVGKLLLICSCIIGALLAVPLSSNANAFNYHEYYISEDELIDNLKLSTSVVFDIFNQQNGLFLWNIQELENLTRFGDSTNITNGQYMLNNLMYEQWLNGLVEDVRLQYHFLKNHIDPTFKHIANIEAEYELNRKCVFMTEKIISWLYYQIATNNELIQILNAVSGDDQGFTRFWNALVRPQMDHISNQKVSLLVETFELGAKILNSANSLPYFSAREEAFLTHVARLADSWWQAINNYAVYDPSFAIAAIDSSILETTYSEWIGWDNFIKLANNGSCPLKDIRNSNFLLLQNYLFTSPQLADQYLTYLEKTAVSNIYDWNEKNRNIKVLYSNDLKRSLAFHLINSYGEHIRYLTNQTVYLFTPKEVSSWIQLEEKYNGYSYFWEKYMLAEQGLATDLYQYRLDDSPLKITQCRTYQGAGDIRGLMDVYNVLRHSFNNNPSISTNERMSWYLIDEITDSQRIDGSFAISPYFGTKIPVSLLSSPLLNDAKIHSPQLLPEGLNEFIGTQTVLNFLLEVFSDLEKYPIDYLSLIKEDLFTAIKSAADLLLSKIDDDTTGIPKQGIVGVPSPTISELFETKPIYVKIAFSYNQIDLDQLPLWINDYNLLDNVGYTRVHQWDFISIYENLYQIFNNTKYLEPLFNSLITFNNDYFEDQEYQLLAICEVKDAIARLLFSEEVKDDALYLSDSSGIYGDLIPYTYRQNVFSITNAFSMETPQRLSSLLLELRPQVDMPIIQPEILQDPINRIVLIGFIGGILIAAITIYIKRPRNK
jgi:hypothetical protein